MHQYMTAFSTNLVELDVTSALYAIEFCLEVVEGQGETYAFGYSSRYGYQLMLHNFKAMWLSPGAASSMSLWDRIYLGASEVLYT